MNYPSGTIWTSSTEFVDKDTGELLTRQKAQNKKKYIKYKTLKKTEYNDTTRRGHIKYIILVERNRQENLFN